MQTNTLKMYNKMFKIAILFLVVHVSLCKNIEVTFKNATFHAYSIYVHKFEKTIEFSNSLAENIPENKIYDKIEFVDQNIPVLYEDSISNIEDNLDELVIQNCGLLEIKTGAFKNVPLLRRISLKGNQLKHIAYGVFNGLPIADLDLSGNEIKTVDSRAFDDLENLLNVRLSENEISTWDPEWFKNTPTLTRISMQNNSITELPAGAFYNLGGVKRLGSLPLKLNLVFSYNKIKNVDAGAFRGLKTLNNLWLDNNLLESFGEHLLENVEVADLRLNSNNIKCLEGDLNKILNAENVHIDSNPFQCECLKKIEDWAKKNDKNVDVFFASMSCYADRIRTKMTALEKRLKDLEEADKKVEKEIESKEEVEWVIPQKKTLKYHSLYNR